MEKPLCRPFITSDVFKFKKDISSPNFTRVLKAGEYRLGWWIRDNYNLLWLNNNRGKDPQFKEWFEFVGKFEDIYTKQGKLIENV